MEAITHILTPKGHEEKWGGYNHFPPNTVQITEAEFAQSKFFVYGPEFTEYRQVIHREPGEPDPIKLCCNSGLRLFYYHDNTGLAMAHDYHGNKVHYFKFGLCEHTYNELTQAQAKAEGVFHGGMCYHVLKCSKCGYTMAQDSSD